LNDKENIPVFSSISGLFTNFPPLDTIRSVAVEKLEPVTKIFVEIVKELIEFEFSTNKRIFEKIIY